MALGNIPRFHRAVAVMNEMDSSKLPKLVSRIAQNMGGDKQEHFTGKERSKLCEVLDMEAENLEAMLETIEQILVKAAYYNWKPAVLLQELISANMSSECSEIVSQGWQKHGKEVIARLKKRTLTAHQLEKVDWHLNLQVAHGSKSKITEPNVVFQFKVNDALKLNGNSVLMEFNHDELLGFYNKLETIQQQIDALS